MTQHRCLTAVLPLLSAICLSGCGSQGSTKPQEAQQSADRTAIDNMVATSPEFEVSFDDGGELLGDGMTPVAAGTQSAQTESTAVLPVHWGRWRVPPNHPPVRTITFLTPPDGDRALVKVNVKYDGWFFVDLTDDGMRNPGKKPLRDQRTRYALFKKIWFHADSTSTDSVFGWRLVAVSPAEFIMIDPARQTVNIHSVTLTGERTHVTITDPATLLSLGHSTGLLPIFRAGENVKVEASITNADQGFVPATFVYLHAPISDRAFPGPLDWSRVLMHDDGTHGDATPGDGTFTATWTVRNLGRSHIAVDVLNSRCLQNETDDDYNSTTWGVPFASYPSFLTSSETP